MFFMDTVTISKSEYERLKRKEKMADDVLVQLEQSAEDIRRGRIHKVYPLPSKNSK